MSYYYHPADATASDACGNPMLPELPLYQGSFYAFDASGGFNLSEGIEKVDLADQSSLELFDLTNCVQVMMDVRLFNAKLGVMKDTTANTYILNDPSTNPYTYPYSTLKTTYNPITQRFEDASGAQHDDLSISGAEFALDISNGGNMSILSVGVLATLYDDFDGYIKEYFGYSGGFASLFEKAGTFEISEAFNEDKLYNLITTTISSDGSITTDGSGNWVADPTYGSSYNYTAGNTKYNADISGGIQVSNIVQSLRFAVDSNVFSNRHPQGEQMPIQNPVATYYMEVRDVCNNELHEDWQMYANGVEKRVFGMTQSTSAADPNNQNTYVYKLDLSHSSLTTGFKLTQGAGTLTWDGATTTIAGINLVAHSSGINPGNAGSYMSFKMDAAFTGANTADPDFSSTPQLFYGEATITAASGHTSDNAGVPQGGGFINTGTYDNAIAQSSDPSGNTGTASPIDASYSFNFGVGDGFMSNDIIFVREGISLEVKIVIDAEAYAPINNIGPFNTAALSTSQSSTFQAFTTDASENLVLGGVPGSAGVEGTFLMNTDVSTTAIKRQVRVPLVIRMANMSSGATAKYLDPMPPIGGVGFAYVNSTVLPPT